MCLTLKKLLKFLDLWTQAAESSTRESKKHVIQSKVFHVSNVANAYLTKMAEASFSKPAKSMKHTFSCPACMVRKHPLYPVVDSRLCHSGDVEPWQRRMNCAWTASSKVTSGHRVCWLIDARCFRNYTRLCCIVHLTLILKPKQTQLMKVARRRWNIHHHKNWEHNIIRMSRIRTLVETKSRLSLWPARSKSVVLGAMWERQVPFLALRHRHLLSRSD